MGRDEKLIQVDASSNRDMSPSDLASEIHNIITDDNFRPVETEFLKGLRTRPTLDLPKVGAQELAEAEAPVGTGLEPLADTAVESAASSASAGVLPAVEFPQKRESESPPDSE